MLILNLRTAKIKVTHKTKNYIKKGRKQTINISTALMKKPKQLEMGLNKK